MTITEGHDEPVASSPEKSAASLGENAASSEVNEQGTPKLGAPRAGRHAVFIITTVATTMSAIDSTIVATALHAIGTSLRASLTWSAWTITIFSLGRLIAMPMTAQLGEKFGRKRIFMLSVGVFTLSSLCCGLASNIYELDAFRFVQALGGGAFIPSSTSLIVDHFGRNRDRALGMFTTLIPIGSMIGPIFGGLFVTYWTWRGIFFINVPIGIAVVLFSLRFIPESRPGSTLRTDVRGICLMACTILSSMFGIAMLGNGSTPVFSAVVVVPEIVAVGLGVLFVRHIKRASDPVVRMAYLRGRSFGAMNTLNFFFGAVTFGLASLVPLYAQDRYHIAVLESGTLLTARGIGVLGASFLAVMAIRYTGPRIPMLFGFGVCAVSLWLLALAPPWLGPYSWLMLVAAIGGIGMGIAAPSSSNAGMRLAPEHASEISGIRGMFRFGGAIVSVAIASAVIARSHHPGHTEAIVFVISGLLLVVVAPLTFVLSNSKGRW